MKRCIVCGVEKPLSEFVQDKNKKDGTRKTCKKCHNLKLRKTPIPPEHKDGYKYCASCATQKPLGGFNLRSYKGEKKPFSYCKECEMEKDNNRYRHTCGTCGKEYRSGSKKTKICKTCHSVELGKMGKNNLSKLRQDGPNNPMYGVRRFGKKNPNYDPDKTDEERTQERITWEYKEWRRSVFERDSFVCQCCGFEKGRYIVAHHLDGHNWCIEKRYDIDNGITLCRRCHKRFHLTYGYKDNTRIQFISFMRHANTEVSNQMAQG